VLHLARKHKVKMHGTALQVSIWIIP
jgi:hypothetical protein